MGARVRREDEEWRVGFALTGVRVGVEEKVFLWVCESGERMASGQARSSTLPHILHGAHTKQDEDDELS